MGFFFQTGFQAVFDYFLGALKLRKKAVSQSAASPASVRGGCASSRLDHGMKFYVIQGGCASSRLINGFSDCVQVEVTNHVRLEVREFV